MRFKVYLSFITLVFITTSCFQTRKVFEVSSPSNYSKEIASPPKEIRIKPAAERTGRYFGRLRQHQKRVAVVANHTSLIGETHLVDSLVNSGINVVKIFTPEHGFRGLADAGLLIDNDVDIKTRLPIVSLYGNHKKPLPEDIADVDIVVFDIQDVGTRFFTYISTMALVMEACAENNVPVLILDRPNPNGFYVDGPLLDTVYSSFVGMHPVPIVHGMTIAEYARMVNEEGWLKNGIKCDLDWIECARYNHSSFYQLPVKPSPNLPDMNSIILYPTTCLFEGTKASVGRGTNKPFSVIGYPDMCVGNYTFTPVSRPGALNPPYKDQVCRGFDYTDSVESIKNKPGIRLQWLIDIYNADTSKATFFTSYFTNLAGAKKLQQQIEAGLNETDIKQTWKAELSTFLDLRSKYLLYRE